MNKNCILLVVLLASIGSGHAQGVTLSPGSVLRYTFNINASAWGTGVPDVMQFGVYGPAVVSSTPATLTAGLYDGSNLLGQVSAAPMTSADIPSLVTLFWKSPSSVWSNPPFAPIDFTSILSGSIQGRIDLEVTGGTVVIPPPVGDPPANYNCCISLLYRTSAGTWNFIPGAITNVVETFVASVQPMISLVANAEGESAIIAPNTWIEVKGLNLAMAGSGRIWQDSDFVRNQMPTQLDGVSVMVNGKAAYVYYISPTQVNVLTPPDPITGPVQVVLTYNGASASYTAQAQATSPSFFIFDLIGNVAATHVDGSFIGPPTLYPGKTTPAKPGETIVLYANGFGKTTVPVVSGATTQSGDLNPRPVIQIGGITANVTFAGLVTSPGEYVFLVEVPPTTPDENQTITATFNGITTQGKATIAVQH